MDNEREGWKVILFAFGSNEACERAWAKSALDNTWEIRPRQREFLDRGRRVRGLFRRVSNEADFQALVGMEFSAVIADPALSIHYARKLAPLVR